MKKNRRYTVTDSEMSFFYHEIVDKILTEFDMKKEEKYVKIYWWIGLPTFYVFLISLFFIINDLILQSWDEIVFYICLTFLLLSLFIWFLLYKIVLKKIWEANGWRTDKYLYYKKLVNIKQYVAGLSDNDVYDNLQQILLEVKSRESKKRFFSDARFTVELHIISILAIIPITTILMQSFITYSKIFPVSLILGFIIVATIALTILEFAFFFVSQPMYGENLRNRNIKRYLKDILYYREKLDQFYEKKEIDSMLTESDTFLFEPEFETLPLKEGIDQFKQKSNSLNEQFSTTDDYESLFEKFSDYQGQSKNSMSQKVGHKTKTSAEQWIQDMKAIMSKD